MGKGFQSCSDFGWRVGDDRFDGGRMRIMTFGTKNQLAWSPPGANPFPMASKQPILLTLKMTLSTQSMRLVEINQFII